MDQLRSLRVFAKVVGEGSFAAAARALDLAPAVVTRVVADLEQHLGARLLNRTTRRLALTEIGEVYLQSARRILEQLDDADALAGASTALAQGRLRVVCPPAFAVHQLARLLPKFSEQFPRITLELSTPGPVEVAGDNFDVSILSLGQQPQSGEFVARTLATSSFIICAAPIYLAHRPRPATPDDLRQHTGVLPASSAARQEITLYRMDARSSAPNARAATIALPPPILCTSSIETIYTSALHGLGIAGLPSFVAHEALRDGRLERLLPQWRGVTLTICAAIPARRQIPKRSRVFVDFLVQAFGGTRHDPWLSDGGAT